MALLLDTDTLEPVDRADAVRAAMRYARVPAELTHDPEVGAVRARIDLWELGGGVSLLHRVGTGVRLRRTPRQVRSAAEDRVSLTVLGAGRWRFAQRDVEQVVDSPHWGVCLVDHSLPYEYQRVGASPMYAVGIDHRALGLSPDVARAAAGRLQASPLLPLVVRHVLDLARTVDDVPAGRATMMLGTATAELVRALVTTATADGGGGLGVDAPTLLLCTHRYIDRYLTERDLTPDRIARAHHVSVRRLYSAWAAAGESIAGYVMAQRLELARRVLAAPAPAERTVAAVARDCGFADAAHFSRRFRAAYGVTPREWRRVSELDRT